MRIVWLLLSVLVAAAPFALPASAQDPYGRPQLFVTDPSSLPPGGVDVTPVEEPDPDDPQIYGPRAQKIFSFDFTDPVIDVDRIIDGGTLPDGIPAISQPHHVPVGEMTELRPDDPVIGVEINGKARAYPVRLLNWHSLVNDTLAGEPITVAWDPLSGTAMAFSRLGIGDGRGEFMDFRVSGLVFQSTALYYDKRSQSLWSPLLMRAVTGEYSGTPLQVFPVFMTYWKEFQRAFPNGTVQTFATNYRRDYTTNPYGNYGRNKRLLFPAMYLSDRLPRKEPVFGVRLIRGAKQVAAAFPVAQLMQWPPGRLDFKFGMHGEDKIIMTLQPGNVPGRFEVFAPPGVAVDTAYAYWFAWSAFYPDTLVIEDLP